MTRRITDQQWAEAWDVLEETGSYSETSRRTGIKRSTLGGKYPGMSRTKPGPPKGKKRTYTDQQWATAKDIVENGFGLAEASRYSGIPESNIRNRYRAQVEPLRIKVRDYLEAQYLLVVEEASYGETERTTGVNRKKLSRLFPEAGWEKAGSQGAEYRRMTRLLDKVEAQYA